MASFPSQTNNQYLAVEGQLYQFQGSILEADHPPLGDASNKVVTTGWIQALLTGTTLYPMTSDATSGNGLLVTVSSGSVPKPNGGTCNISALTVPLAVNSSSNEYVYIRYADCQVVISTVVPNSEIGLLISLVETNETNIVKITNYASFNSWAKIDSPFFTGNPQAPTPEEGVCDNSIATTEFVCNAFNSPSLETSPNVTDCSNKVATTEYVCEKIIALLRGEPLEGFPKLVDAGGLNVNVTEGVVTKPDGSECNIVPLSTPVGLSPNTTEYVYIRYVDCAVVVSNTSPDSTMAMLIGTTTTDHEKIIEINQIAGSLKGWFNQYFQVGFGGNIVPK